MKGYIMKALYAVLGIAFIVVVAFVGCRSSQRKTKEARKPEPVQMFEMSAGSNYIAQTTELIEVEADIHLPDRFAPVRVKLRIMPGTWLVPEQMLSISEENGVNVICTNGVCEVRR